MADARASWIAWARSEDRAGLRFFIKDGKLSATLPDGNSNGRVVNRRHHALYLTGDGTRLMARLGQIGAAHEDDICAPLNAAERAQLHGLLTRIAGHHELTAGVHPGYRD